MRPLAGLVVAFALALLALVPVAALAPSTALAHAPTSALPHETGAPEPPTPKQLDEARQLTDGLRAGATSKPRADAIRDRLARQATRRAALLADIAVRDPRAALDLALSPAERAALPQDVQGSVEAWTDLDGDLVVLHVDDEHGRGYYDVKLVVGGTETKLHVGGTVGAQPGDEVKVTGVRLPGDNSVVAEQVIAQRAGSGVGPTGPQRTSIILAGPRGASAHPYADKSAVASMFFSTTSGRSARAWYDEASYGQATIVGGSGTEGTAADVYGPYTVNSATCSTTTIRTEAFAAADAQLNFNRYDRVMILWNHPPCGNGGVGSVGPRASAPTTAARSSSRWPGCSMRRSARPASATRSAASPSTSTATTSGRGTRTRSSAARSRSTARPARAPNMATRPT